MKPSLLDKLFVKEQINLVEIEVILKMDLEIAEVSNTFHGNIVKNLGIKYSVFDPMTDKVKDPTLRAIVKYTDHPVILAIQNKCKNQIKFAFEKNKFG